MHELRQLDFKLTVLTKSICSLQQMLRVSPESFLPYPVLQCKMPI